MLSKLNINVYSSYIEIPCNNFLCIYSSKEYHNKLFVEDIVNSLTKKIWRKVNKYGRWINQPTISNLYFYHNQEDNYIRFPRNILDKILNKIDSQIPPIPKEDININYIEPYTPAKISFSMLPKWVDREEQGPPIKQLSREDSSMVATDLRVGVGKTYCAIKASCILGYVTMVVCGGLVEQWKESYLDKTDIKEDKICCINGIKPLLRLLQENEMPDVIIWSIHTLRSYVFPTEETYKALPSYQEFQKYFGIGIIIRDEFHQNLDANLKIDMNSNVKHNLYLSATPSRSDVFEKKVFNMVYPQYMIDGKNDLVKYVNTYTFSYSTPEIKPKYYSSQQGYSQIKYEDFILKNAYFFESFFNILNSVFQQAYINKVEKYGDFKILIFCARIDMCLEVTEKLKELYPDYKISEYVSSSKDDVLFNNDVIVTTIGKCGTGKDIKGLASIINTHSTKNSIMIEQMFGRLRNRTDGVPLDLYDIHNRNNETQVNLADQRFRFYKMNSADFQTY